MPVISERVSDVKHKRIASRGTPIHPPPQQTTPCPGCLQPEHDFQPLIKTRTNERKSCEGASSPAHSFTNHLQHKSKENWVRGVTAEAWTPRWPAKVRKSRLACHPSPFWCLGNPQQSNAEHCLCLVG